MSTTAISHIYSSEHGSNQVAQALTEAFEDQLENHSRIEGNQFPTINREELSEILSQPGATTNTWANHGSVSIKGVENPGITSVFKLFGDFSLLKKCREFIDTILEDAKPKLNHVAATVKTAFENQQERLRELLDDFDGMYNLNIRGDFNSFLGASPLDPATES